MLKFGFGAVPHAATPYRKTDRTRPTYSFLCNLLSARQDVADGFLISVVRSLALAGGALVAHLVTNALASLQHNLPPSLLHYSTISHRPCFTTAQPPTVLASLQQISHRPCFTTANLPPSLLHYSTISHRPCFTTAQSPTVLASLQHNLPPSLLHYSTISQRPCFTTAQSPNVPESPEVDLQTSIFHRRTICQCPYFTGGVAPTSLFHWRIRSNVLISLKIRSNVLISLKIRSNVLISQEDQLQRPYFIGDKVQRPHSIGESAPMSLFHSRANAKSPYFTGGQSSNVLVPLGWSQMGLTTEEEGKRRGHLSLADL